MTDKKPEISIDEMVADAERWIADKFEEDACSMKSKIGRLCLIFREPVITRLAARQIVKPKMKMKSIREMMAKYINENESIAETLRDKGHELPIEFCHAEFLTAMRKAFEADRTLYGDALKVMDRSSRAMKERIKKRGASAPKETATEAKPSPEAVVSEAKPAQPIKELPKVNRLVTPVQRPAYQQKAVSVPGVTDSAPTPASTLSDSDEELAKFGEFERD